MQTKQLLKDEIVPEREQLDTSLEVEESKIISKGMLQSEWNIDTSEYSPRRNCNDNDAQILEDSALKGQSSSKESDTTENRKLQELKNRNLDQNRFLQMSIFDKNINQNDKQKSSQNRSRNPSESPPRNRSKIQHPESSLLGEINELNASNLMPKDPNKKDITMTIAPVLFCQQSGCENIDKQFLIRITGYQKITGPFKPFIKYTIESEVRDTYSTQKYIVKRRFTEFKRLKTYLHQTYFACIQPPFPDSSMAESLIPFMQLFQSDKDMIASRSSKLEIYLQNLGMHDEIKLDHKFELFLSQQEEFQDIEAEQSQVSRISTIASYYSPLKGILSGLQYFFNTPNKAVFFSDEDRVIGKSLFQHATYFSDIEEQLMSLRQIYSNNDFEKLADELKEGENTVQSPEGFKNGFQEIYLQNDALFYFFKYYHVKQDSDRIKSAITQLNEILNILQQAKEAFQRYCERKELFIASMGDENKETLKIKETPATDEVNSELILNNDALQQENLSKQKELPEMKNNQVNDGNRDPENMNNQHTESLQQNKIIEEDDDDDDRRIIWLDDDGKEQDCSTDFSYQDQYSIEKDLLESQQKELLRKFEEIKQFSLPKALEDFAVKAIQLLNQHYEQEENFYETCKSQIKDH